MRIFFLPLLMIGMGPAKAAPPVLEDLDRLDRGIAVALGGTSDEIGKRAQLLDRRLRIALCPEGPVFDTSLPNAITASCPSKGWRLRVPLVGRSATPSAEVFIRRGDAVQLAYVGSGFEISTSAIALDDGREGGSVRVKTPTATAPLTARVRAPGEVEIGD